MYQRKSRGREAASCVVVLLGALAASASAQPATLPSELPPPVVMTAQEDITRMAHEVGVEPILRRPSYNYDESKANPYPDLPDPLMLKNGQKVTDAKMWFEQRRPEILEDFEREVYGRTPKNTPKVTWEVISTTRGMLGSYAVVTKQLVGHVDNSAYPHVKLDIQVNLTTPASAKAVPVIMQFGGFGFGFPAPGGRGRGPATSPTSQPFAARGPATGPASTQPLAQRRGGFGAGPAAGPNWQQQLLAKGWGYAILNTGSVQADNGAGLTSGIIGLVNKGQPRKVDDWGALAAWAWGASRFLDYCETDPSVDARQVGLEGHSRWGKATLLAMALDPRFAIAYVSSSGEGGAKLHRRNFGQPLSGQVVPEEYHWTAGNLLKYGTKWNDLPVDSHELIALCAPRPVFISGGAAAGDRAVDPKGSFMAAAAAGPVYELLGKKGLTSAEMPPVNVADIDGDLGFRLHDQGHTDAPNWPTFITFASRYLKAPQN
jgi:hypothetical protein